MPADLLTDATAVPSVAVEALDPALGLGVSAAARLFPAGRNGRPVHPATLTRWIAAGVRLADGRVVKLEAVRIGGRLVTSRPALARFIAAQQHDALPPPPPVRTPAARRRAGERAAARLVEMGC